jgi:glycosyltransferase involved in cell wall biosynthesis
MDLSVVVVTYQSRDHILACLRSLDAGTRAAEGRGAPLAWECVVMDNDSRDGTPELVEREAPWARVVRTGANLGYAKAVNRGIAATQGNVRLVLNPDCVWSPGRDPRARPRGTRRTRAAASRRRGSEPGWLARVQRARLPGLVHVPVQSLLAAHRAVAGQSVDAALPAARLGSREPRSVDWVSGAAMLARGPRSTRWAPWTRRSSCSTRTWTGAGA